MRTIRCRKCKQMFSYEGLPPDSCPLCAMAKNERFSRVRELVQEYPGITTLEVNQHTGVPVSDILDFLKKGELQEATVISYRAQEDLNELRNKTRLKGSSIEEWYGDKK